MRLIKTDDAAFTGVHRDLTECKSLRSKEKRLSGAAKKFIGDWLAKHRNIDLNALPSGQIIVIQVDGKDCIKVERKSTNRIDVTRLQQEDPTLAEKYTAPSPATYYDPL